MGIGTGILLLVAGLVLAFNAIEVDLSFIDDGALGAILIVGGILAIGLSLFVNAQRQRSTRTVVDDRPVGEDRVVERRVVQDRREI